MSLPALGHPSLLITLTSDAFDLIIALLLDSLLWNEREDFSPPCDALVGEGGLSSQQGGPKMSQNLVRLLCLFVHMAILSWEALPPQSAWVRKVSSNSYRYVPSTSGCLQMLRTYCVVWIYTPDSFFHQVALSQVTFSSFWFGLF